ncbi:unnamed protein product [Caretta caretta]
MVLGKPFGDLANIFVKSVLHSGPHSGRIDITFDRYRQNAMKRMMQQKCSQASRPIWKITKDKAVPLPNSRPDFLAHPDNKADVACFFSEVFLANAPQNRTIVVAGGFRDDMIKSSNPTLGTSKLQADHEEADTRTVLLCMYTDVDCIPMSAQDTDVLLLLMAHYE